MDWRWRKRSSEKTIVANDKVDDNINEDKVQTFPIKAIGVDGFAKMHKSPNKSKDDLIAQHARATEEALAGREKAEAKAILLKQELEEAMRQQEAANVKLAHVDSELQECRQQLEIFRKETQQKIKDAVIETSREFVLAHEKLEETLIKSNRKLSSLSAENTHLIASLSSKEKVIEDLTRQAIQAGSEFDALMGRLDSTEKENAFLKYEYCVLKKELAIRNEELEYNRQCTDASHKKYLDSIKKISKLEEECQKLRVLMQKRLPGPAALSKMKSEVKMLSRDQADTRRKSSPRGGTTVVNTMSNKSHDAPSKNVDFLIDYLHDVEQENKSLKEIVSIKDAELRSSKDLCAETTSKLVQVEAQVKELRKGQSFQLAKFELLSKDLPSSLESCYNSGISSSGSWANALLSELEQFKNIKHRNPFEREDNMLASMGSTDDFVEMEKFAIVSAESPSSIACPMYLTGQDLQSDDSSSCDMKHVYTSKTEASAKSFDWLQVVLSAMMKQNHISGRCLVELFEDIRIALGLHNHPAAQESGTTSTLKHDGELECPLVTGYLPWKSTRTPPIKDSASEAASFDTLQRKMNKQQFVPNLGESIHKIIDLIDGLKQAALDDIRSSEKSAKNQNSLSSSPATPVDYCVRVFQWKSSEMTAIVQSFTKTCFDLLDGKADIERFVEELAMNLDWILNNNASKRHSSSAREKIKRRINWNETPNEDLYSTKDNSQLLEIEDKEAFPDKQSSSPHSVSSLHGPNIPFQIEKNQITLQEENERLKYELKNMESSKDVLEARLQSANANANLLTTQLKRAEENITSLSIEIKDLKESKRMIEDQAENQKSINEDLDTQLSVTKAKLNEVLQKFTSLEVELEDKSNCCAELESTCLELQLQLESVVKLTPKCPAKQEQMLSQTGWEITAASVKLAECQETILSLGRQLKALTSPRESAILSKVLSAPANSDVPTYERRRSSLRDRMLAEDDTEENLRNQEMTSTTDASTLNALVPSNNLIQNPEGYYGLKQKSGSNSLRTLALVPRKKQGAMHFLGRLLLRRKKGGRKKSHSFTFGQI